MAPPRADCQRSVLLAIDTSTDQAGVALYDGAVIADVAWPATRASRRLVLPEITHVLTLAERTLESVVAIGVALGPGSFSALRTGLSLAKGLAYARRCPIVGISTLDVVSYPHWSASVPVWSVVQAGRGRVVAACYPPAADGRREMTQPYYGTLAGLLERISGPAVVSGEAPRDMIQALAHHADVFVPSPAVRQRRPAVLAEMAWQRWRAGQADDPFTLEPVYLHGDGGGERAVLP